MDLKGYKKSARYFFKNIFNFKGELPFHLYKRLISVSAIWSFFFLIIFMVYIFENIFSNPVYTDLPLKEIERLEGIEQFKTFNFIVLIFLSIYLSTLSTEIKRFRFLKKSPAIYLAAGFIGIPLIYAYSYYANIIMQSPSTISVLGIILIPWFANSKNKVTDRDQLYKDYDFEEIDQLK